MGFLYIFGTLEFQTIQFYFFQNVHLVEASAELLQNVSHFSFPGSNFRGDLKFSRNNFESTDFTI